ncbi:hypothetical protein LN050_03535 [Comamonadaceae bacterium M7527]|nr:hypothetical protein LN050_03535 [Comamonadaceae bacterium M7527]
MKHTVTLTTLAAAMLAAAVPLAAQAQTSQLTISVGPEPAIEPTLTCGTPTNGTLVPVVKKGTADGAQDGELIRFTTDNEIGANEALQSAVEGNTTAGTRTAPSQPQLTVSWTRGSSTATNKYIQIKATLPTDLQTKLNSTMLSDGTTFTYGAIPTATSNAPSTANTTSHAVLTDPTQNSAKMTVQQKYENGVITLSIAPSGTGDNAFLPALAATPLSLDLTLVATDGPYRLKPLADGTTANISWTCSTVNKTTYNAGI